MRIQKASSQITKNKEKQTYEITDVNGMLTYLYTKVLKLERQLITKRGKKATDNYENVLNNVNTVLTDEELAKRCLQCHSLKIIGGILKCSRHQCKYNLIRGN